MIRPPVPGAGAAILAAALVAAFILAAAIARCGRPALRAAILVAAVLLLPAIHVVLGPSPPLATAAALLVVALPVLASGFLRWPPGQWRTARALGASPALIARRLGAPALLPFLLAAALAGGALLLLRPPPPHLLLLPYPRSETG